jgi:hypothetical protein
MSAGLSPAHPVPARRRFSPFLPDVSACSGTVTVAGKEIYAMAESMRMRGVVAPSDMCRNASTS